MKTGSPERPGRSSGVPTPRSWRRQGWRLLGVAGFSWLLMVVPTSQSSTLAQPPPLPDMEAIRKEIKTLSDQIEKNVGQMYELQGKLKQATETVDNAKTKVSAAEAKVSDAMAKVSAATAMQDMFNADINAANAAADEAATKAKTKSEALESAKKRRDNAANLAKKGTKRVETAEFLANHLEAAKTIAENTAKVTSNPTTKEAAEKAAKAANLAHEALEEAKQDVDGMKLYADSLATEATTAQAESDDAALNTKTAEKFKESTKAKAENAAEDLKKAKEEHDKAAQELEAAKKTLATLPPAIGGGAAPAPAPGGGAAPAPAPGGGAAPAPAPGGDAAPAPGDEPAPAPAGRAARILAVAIAPPAPSPPQRQVGEAYRAVIRKFDKLKQTWSSVQGPDSTVPILKKDDKPEKVAQRINNLSNALRAKQQELDSVNDALQTLQLSFSRTALQLDQGARTLNDANVNVSLADAVKSTNLGAWRTTLQERQSNFDETKQMLESNLDQLLERLSKSATLQASISQLLCELKMTQQIDELLKSAKQLNGPPNP